jgi:hypothetical protein
VSEFLVTYLDSIDERLLDYLDEEGEPRPEVVKRLHYNASAFMEGSITPLRRPRTVGTANSV